MNIRNVLGLLVAVPLLAACGPSLTTMHAHAREGVVETGAPLHARHSVVIAAPREHVYELLVDFASWPRWQPEVTRVTPPARVAPDTAFTWVKNGSEIHSQLAAVDPGVLVAWTGSVSTAKAVHVWRLSSPTPDTTRVDVDETMDGFLLTWFYSQKDLDADMTHSLEELRAAVEHGG